MPASAATANARSYSRRWLRTTRLANGAMSTPSLAQCSTRELRVDVIETKERRGRLHGALTFGLAGVDKVGARSRAISPRHRSARGLDIGASLPFHVRHAAVHLGRGAVGEELLDGFAPKPGPAGEANEAQNESQRDPAAASAAAGPPAWRAAGLLPPLAGDPRRPNPLLVYMPPAPRARCFETTKGALSDGWRDRRQLSDCGARLRGDQIRQPEWIAAMPPVRLR